MYSSCFTDLVSATGQSHSEALLQEERHRGHIGVTNTCENLFPKTGSESAKVSTFKLRVLHIFSHV